MDDYSRIVIRVNRLNIVILLICRLILLMMLMNFRIVFIGLFLVMCVIVLVWFLG